MMMPNKALNLTARIASLSGNHRASRAGGKLAPAFDRNRASLSTAAG